MNTGATRSDMAQAWRGALHGMQRGSQRLGWPGRLGLLLGLMAAGLWVALMPGLQEQTDALNAHNAWLQGRLGDMSPGRDQKPASATRVTSATGTGTGTVTAPQAWQSVWSALPTEAQGLALPSRLLQGAPGVSGEPATFQRQAVPGLPGLTRVQVGTSLTAPWLQLSAWLGQVQAQPGVSIDALSLERERVDEPLWHLRVSLSVWVRDGVGVNAGPADHGAPAAHTARALTAQRPAREAP